jgi:hypothetical protein
MAAYSSAWHPETTHVEKVDDLTREKLRDGRWLESIFLN